MSAKRPSPWWLSQTVAKERFSRMKNVGAPCDGRSVVSGRPRQISRTAARMCLFVTSEILHCGRCLREVRRAPVATRPRDATCERSRLRRLAGSRARAPRSRDRSRRRSGAPAPLPEAVSPPRRRRARASRCPTRPRRVQLPPRASRPPVRHVLYRPRRSGRPARAGARWRRGTTRRPRPTESETAGPTEATGTPRRVAEPRRLRQCLLEVGPERLGILEPRAETEQSRRDAIPFPAPAALDQARHAAERARVDDHLGRRLDPPCSLGVGDVEGEQPAEAGIAHGLDRRMRTQPLGKQGGGLGLPPYPELEGPQAAQQEPGGIRRGDDAGATAERA